MRIEFRSDRRGYMLMLERDLFGAFILYRRWYGLDNRRGGEKRQVFFDEETVLREVRKIQNARKRHGYRTRKLSPHSIMLLLALSSSHQ